MNQNENGLPGSQKGFEEALQILEAFKEMATVMMELIRKPAVNYYNYGTIQNLVCGDYHAHAPISTDMKGGLRQKTFTDEQVSVALKACVGKGKVINNKKKWAGAYWCLRKLHHAGAQFPPCQVSLDSTRIGYDDGRDREELLGGLHL